MPSEQELADMQRMSNDYIPDVTVIGLGIYALVDPI